MGRFIAEVLGVLLLLLYAVAVMVCWVCTLLVSSEIFLPVAIGLTGVTVIALIGIIGGIK